MTNNQMSPEAQRVEDLAIATALGYVPCDQWVPFNSYSMWNDPENPCNHPKCYPRSRGPAKFTENANLWPQMWEALTREEKEGFLNLADAGLNKQGMSFSEGIRYFEHYIVGMLQPQKVELWLRIKGEWKEGV